MARSRDGAFGRGGEFAVGFAVPSYFAFEDRLSGFDIQVCRSTPAWITSGPAAILKGARHPNAARAFAEFLLSSVTHRHGRSFPSFLVRIEGPPGSAGSRSSSGERAFALQHAGVSVYDEALAEKRCEAVNSRFRAGQKRWRRLKNADRWT